MVTSSICYKTWKTFKLPRSGAQADDDIENGDGEKEKKNYWPFFNSIFFRIWLSRALSVSSI